MKNSILGANSKLNEIAARWFIRMQEAGEDSSERAQFEKWLMQSDQHQAEYASISHAWDGIDSIEELKRIAKIQQANHLLDKANRSKKLKKTFVILSVVFILLFAGLMGEQSYQQWLNTPTMQMASQTKPAEVVTKTLDDGSQIILNGSSKLQVNYYPKQRHVAMLQGEAIFQVTKDADRPFVVETSTAKITVLGTRFAVNKLTNLVRVSVDHGSVKVESVAPASVIILRNGEVAEISNGKKVIRKNGEAIDYFRFATGTLVFNQADIFEIADELARYRSELVSAEGKSQDRISAVLDVKNIPTFLHTLPKIANVSVMQTKDSTLIKANK